MSDNKAFRATVSYLIVRDLAHEKVFAKALESLGVNWDKTFPVPKTDSSKMPEVQELEKRNFTISNGHLLTINQDLERYLMVHLHLEMEK